jgi:signal transduction histidine kinase
VLQRLIPTFDSAQNYTRQLIEEISPPRLYDIGLGASLQWLSVYIRGQSGLQVDLQVDINERALGLELRAAAFHIVRELVDNVVQHAQVTAAQVAVNQDGRMLRIEVADQGAGFDLQHDLFTDQPGGFGLLAIEDRVRSANGSLRVATARGKGCHVTVHLPA